MTTTYQSAYAEGVVFPSAWRKDSREWAEDQHLPQSVVNDIERRLIAFRQKRDAYQTQRQSEALTMLEPLVATLKGEIDLLRTQVDRMGIKKTADLSWTDFQAARAHNNKRDALYDNLIALSWRYQAAYAQMSAINTKNARHQQHQATLAALDAADKLPQVKPF